MVATIDRALPYPSTEDAERLRQFEAVCLRDMALLAGVSDIEVGRRALEALFGGRARQFARDMADFDAEIDECGVAFASQGLMARYGGQIVPEGVEHVPREGPALFVGNHPGLMDSLAIYATAPRPDVQALARPQPLLLLLSALAPNLLLLPDDGPERGGALRAVLCSLRAGGALVLFPAGHLEPEPCLPETGAEPLGPWSSGLGTLVRLAARDGLPLRIVPTAVSGVLSTETWRRFRPLIRLRRTVRGRADLAAFLQLAFPSLGPTTVRVRYGAPLHVAELAAGSPDSATLTARVRDVVRSLLAASLTGDHPGREYSDAGRRA